MYGGNTYGSNYGSTQQSSAITEQKPQPKILISIENNQPLIKTPQFFTSYVCNTDNDELRITTESACIKNSTFNFIDIKGSGLIEGSQLKKIKCTANLILINCGKIEDVDIEGDLCAINTKIASVRAKNVIMCKDLSEVQKITS